MATGDSKASSSTNYQENVFVNCPFDPQYESMFLALLFAVFDCGFVPRCALEVDDGSQVRIDKITRIIEESRFGIHDISRTELDSDTGLPRFNMPLELGLFLGARKFGDGVQKSKNCLILDVEEYRYRTFVSDISGQDIRAHDCEPERAIKVIRNWLSTSSGRRTIPGGAAICQRYQRFTIDMPVLCKKLSWRIDELTFQDLSYVICEWLRAAD